MGDLLLLTSTVFIIIFIFIVIVIVVVKIIKIICHDVFKVLTCHYGNLVYNLIFVRFLPISESLSLRWEDTQEHGVDNL